MAISSKFRPLQMAANPEYVFSQMEARVMNGRITGESALLKKVVAAQQEVEVQQTMPQAVTCHQAP